MVQEQIVIQRRENEDLLTRNQKLYDQYTRIDIECNRMSEDLLAVNSLLEQHRNECANLRAEKKIWEVSVCLLRSGFNSYLFVCRAFKLASLRRTRVWQLSAPTSPT